MKTKFTMFGKRQFVASVQPRDDGFAWVLRRVGGGQIAHGVDRTETGAVEAAKDEAQRIEVASHFA